MAKHKSESEKAATLVYNGLIHLTNFGDAEKFKVLQIVEHMMTDKGYESIAIMLRAAQKVVI